MCIKETVILHIAVSPVCERFSPLATDRVRRGYRSKNVL